jgi:hypothetical protein
MTLLDWWMITNELSNELQSLHPYGGNWFKIGGAY